MQRQSSSQLQQLIVSFEAVIVAIRPHASGKVRSAFLHRQSSVELGATYFMRLGLSRETSAACAFCF